MSSVIFLRKYAEDLQPAAMAGDGISKNAGSSPSCHTKQCSKWSVPVGNVVKLNTDAAFQAESGVSAAGAVARDRAGHVVVSMSRNLTPSRTVEEAEAKAALAGLHSLAKYYRGPLILEMDCQAIVKELDAGGGDRSQCFALIKDIKQALAMFASSSVNHVGRTSNALAHKLAAAARNGVDQEIVSDVPEELQQLMIAEFISPTE